MDPARATPAGDPLRPFRPALAFGFFNAINWQVALGTPMVLLVGEVGGSTFDVGLCYAFVFLMTPIQVLSTPLLTRFGFKRMMMSGWGLRALFLLPCVAVAVAARDGGRAPWMLPVMIASTFFFAFFRSLGSCAWMPWLYRLLPESARGRYFASEQLITGAASVGILLGCSVLFKALSIFDAFVVEYVVAFAGAGLSYWALSRMADTEKPKTMPLRRVFVEAPAVCLRPGRFRDFLWVGCLFGFATTAIPPFGIYYLRVESGITPGDILMYSTMQYTGVSLMSFLIRNEIDRRGSRPFFFATGVFYAAIAVFWLALLVFRFDAGSFLPLVYLFLGMGAALWAAAYPNYLPNLVAHEDRPLVLSVYGAATAFVSGVAPVVWGLVLKKDGPVPGIVVPGFIAFFVFVLVSMAVVVFWLRRFEYPKAQAGRVVLGDVVLRPWLAVTFFINLVDETIAPDAAPADPRASRSPSGPDAKS